MIVVLGLVAVRNIAVDILPVFKAPAVQVLTYFQGMPASSIEKTITNRIERWVNQSPGVERIESKSVPGVSVVKLYFRDDIDPNAALDHFLRQDSSGRTVFDGESWSHAVRQQGDGWSASAAGQAWGTAWGSAWGSFAWGSVWNGAMWRGDDGVASASGSAWR